MTHVHVVMSHDHMMMHVIPCEVFLFSQVPAIMDHASFLDPCTNGVGYSLMITVPSFYLLSAVLFTILGVVIVYWDGRTGGEVILHERLKTDITEVPEQD